MKAFIRGFAAGTDVSLQEADEGWQLYSRQLSDNRRRVIERGGYLAGLRMGKRFRRDYREQI